MDAKEAGERLSRWEARTEMPLFALSLLFLACYAVRVLARDTDPLLRNAALAGLLAAWLVFAADYAVRLVLSGQGLRFPRSHGLDTLVLALPLLRPLRMVRVYTAVQRRRAQPRLSLHARVMAYASLSAVLLGFAGSLAVYSSERSAPGASIRTFGDSVWWAAATLSTVGYGDVSPVTGLGRLIAVGLMGCGIALLGAVTGSFSSWLLQTFAREDEKRPPGSG
ncbi:potassium channel family protein [Streptomyces sp. NPDC051322]|uniref:potassium channel family protein n=1 Tax=Streptomyces sp. NPDC051322 TaxID=3154645 RepID=UPI00344EFC0B